MDDQPDATGFVDDQDRIDYLRRHLQVVHDLIDEGIPLGGYFAWSLMDNFEWAYGYTERFGLIRVDYDTLERTPKASAAVVRRGRPLERGLARRLCVSVQASAGISLHNGAAGYATPFSSSTTSKTSPMAT